MTGTIDPRAIPWDAPERLARLNGVVAAGLLSEVECRRRPRQGFTRGGSRQPDRVEARGAGRLAGIVPRRARHTRLGTVSRQRALRPRRPRRGPRPRCRRAAWASAGVERLPAIFIGDQLFLVMGVLRDVVRKPELLGSVIIPEGTARQYFGLLGPGTVVVETKIGAASLIGAQARAALRPDDPRALRVQLPLEPRRVRDEVQTDFRCHVLAARRPVAHGRVRSGSRISLWWA